MQHVHAVVWIDHDEAHVIHFNPDESEELTVHSKPRRGHLHHRSGQLGDGRALEDHDYFGKVEAALAGAQEILIVGPASAKEELQKHMKQHAKALASGIVGVERVDHPSDGQILKLARKYFKAVDKIRQAH